MTEHILDLSERPTHLSVRLDNIVIRPEGLSEMRIPLDEVAVVIASHPQVTLTHAVLSGLASRGGTFVCCDEKHRPVGMLLPLQAHHVQTARFADQAAASLPLRKRLWKQLVRAKINAQAAVLEAEVGTEAGLRRLSMKVRSGDLANVEAQASRRYWKALFEGYSFKRERYGGGPNSLLNYGYAVLRAVVARALCSSGLHPGIPLHHCNQYNPFCLADDVMEPYRPLVDSAVKRWTREHGFESELTRECKAALVKALTSRYEAQGESRLLFNIVRSTASSLATVFAGLERRLYLPVVVPATPGMVRVDEDSTMSE